MKNIKYSSKWKTDPRAAYIPGVMFASFLIIFCLFAGPAWSFETSQGGYEVRVSERDVQALTSSPSNASSPDVVDSCLPLLKSIHRISPSSAMDRNQRSAGKVAALGLVLGVRFALTPPQKTRSAVKPRLDVWQLNGVQAGNRSALAVSAYRQCQKEQALQALNEFRWAR